MVVTIVLVGIVVAIGLLAVCGEWVVWHIPAYRKFADLVHRLGGASVKTVKGAVDVNVPLKSVSRWRIPEVFDTTDSSAAGLTLMQCFGVFFMKDEALDEALSDVKRNSSLILIVGIVGVAIVLVQNPAGAVDIENADLWEKGPLLLDLLVHNHWVLVGELLAVGFSLIFVVQTGALLRRMSRLCDD